MDDISDLLDTDGHNWGKWGDSDQLGAVNYLTADQVLAGVAAVERGEVISLGLPLCRPSGDPVIPGRISPQHYVVQDKGHTESAKIDRTDYAGTESADDLVHLPTHGTTHVDALGHVWYDDQLYNGFDADTTKGGLDRCAVDQLGEHGIVGRAVLVDVARHRGTDSLDPDERVTLAELRRCADDQGVEIRQRDQILIRTGVSELYYRDGPEAFHETYIQGGDGDALREPGLTYSEPLIEWLDDREISFLGTDTCASEQTLSETTESLMPLHPALLRDLGIVIGELLKLDELAEACAKYDDYSFMFTCSPLKIARGTASPVNPLAIL